MKEFDFADIQGFDWDKGNIDKNWTKHEVLFWECEEVFANRPLLIQADEKHFLDDEKRFYVLGRTNEGRFLFEVFTIRNFKIRVISARSMSKKEKDIYLKQYER